LRIVVDEQGRDHADHLPHAFVKKVQTTVDKGTAIKVVDAKRDALRNMIKRAEQQAEQQSPELIDDARARSEQLLQGEVQRLQALARVNPHVRSDEIEFFQQQQQALTQLLDHARLRLDALRVIVVAG
jgi:ATP-dependent helicase HepA